MQEGDIPIKKGKNDITRDYLIIDAHLDLLFDVVRKRELGRRKVIESDYLPGFLKGGVNVIVSSIYIDDIFLPEMALRRALNQISALYSEIDESPSKIMICRNSHDIKQAQNENKLGIMLSFEGVEPLYNDLSLLRIFYELGVRGVGLVWSRRNYAADGCHYSKTDEGTRGGITDFGVELIRKAEEMGMFIDVSHLNDEGFWDVIQIARKPVVASHSNCRSLANTMRNLTDSQIKAIASGGGVIGINASNILAADRDACATPDYLINHIDHIVDLVGPKHVGIGFDLCDRILGYIPNERLSAIPRKPFDVIKGHKDINSFIEKLIKRGYSTEDLRLILGGNLLRVFDACLE